MGKKRYTIFLVPVVGSHSDSRLPHARHIARSAKKFALLLAYLETDPDFAGTVIAEQISFVEALIDAIPSLAERLQRAIQTGQIDVGTWYVPTIGSMVSGEALLRNLEAGKQFRETLALGEAPISFAPPAGNFVRQLPQLLDGYGIRNAFTEHAALGDSFTCGLVGPDGTEILVGPLEAPRLSADSMLSTKTLRGDIVSGRDKFKNLNSALQQVLFFPAYAALETPSLATDIEQATKRLRSSQVEIGSLNDFFSSLQEDGALSSGSRLFSGVELPTSPVHMDGALSSRIWIAQQNSELQTLLEKWVEPLHAWALHLDSERNQGQFAADIQSSLIQQAWKTLLKNQAYPEISGSWQDDLETEIRFRFDSVRQLGEEVLAQSLAVLTGAIDTSANKPANSSSTVHVLNTNGFTLDDRVSVRLKIEESLWPFGILNADGQNASFEIADYAVADGMLDVDVDLVATAVPGYGYQTFYIVGAKDNGNEVPSRDDGLVIANEFMEVQLDAQNGTLSMLDNVHGVAYEGLNHFIDMGDRGDCLQFLAVPRDTVIDIAANTPLSVTRSTSALGETLEYFQIYRLPIQLSEDRESRLPLAAQFAPLSIRTRVEVTYGLPRVDVEVEISNDARDHRLQVQFPVPYAVAGGWVDSHFEVAYADFGAGFAQTNDYAVRSFAQQGFVSLVGEDTGLTVASRGLPEGYFLSDGSQGAVRLTLLRSVGRIRENDTVLSAESAQCLETYNYQYRLIPHGADVTSAWQQARAFANPLLGMQAAIHKGYLPPADSFVRSHTDSFVLSAVKVDRDSQDLIIRGYSVSSGPEQVTLSTNLPVIQAYEVSLGGDKLAPVAVGDSGQIQVEVGPHEIKTLRLRTRS